MSAGRLGGHYEQSAKNCIDDRRDTGIFGNNNRSQNK